ncbi:Maf family protein [Thorsellia anophelis]|uniref:dTTP/UTP pyrophosphatase n=1 Tax=Thorsellia anophelis DSM 18579 TaxID=1123402 RepID=A0A1I0EFM0_9GAMM|nr:Maf family protein [Thorsellia anophelis]SET44078.1 septum formation protein [Thorsellia anophelis DSM 18579]
MQQTLFLASTSPRRFELLSSLDIPFDVLHINVPEIKSPNELPETYVQRLSRDKAIAGIEMTIGKRIVIGADTIGVLDDLVLEKPRDESDAILMLKQLSGRTHTVLTGLTVATETKSITDVIKAEVTFRKLSEEEIIKYVATKEPLDKAGSYGIQGRGGAFVKSINGNYQAIIGLPLAHLIEMLSDIK